ncbi:hypothetical protein AJ88_48580 [Mesorhizobium amorphae CCBAU 01583]|nr:hypothetical protein AJ88_48580 [Mesorhizobium amorphae CCBAU 01583]
MLCVGMLRIGEKPLRHIVLAHRPVLHDVDIVGELAHHGQVVGDQDHRHPQFLLQVANEVEDLRLDGDVECRRRLVGDQHVRIVG